MDRIERIESPRPHERTWAVTPVAQARPRAREREQQRRKRSSRPRRRRRATTTSRRASSTSKPDRVDGPPMLPRRAELIARHGAWTAHNIDLGGGVWTIGPGLAGASEQQPPAGPSDGRRRRPRPVSAVSASSTSPASRGSTPSSSRGAARPSSPSRRASRTSRRSASRATRSASATGSRSSTATCATRRADRLGTFDVVLCLGILYHLEAPDALALLRAAARWPRGGDRRDADRAQRRDHRRGPQRPRLRRAARRAVGLGRQHVVVLVHAAVAAQRARRRGVHLGQRGPQPAGARARRLPRPRPAARAQGRAGRPARRPAALARAASSATSTRRRAAVTRSPSASRSRLRHPLASVFSKS